MQGARAAAAGHRVDEDQRVPGVEQVVGQVHAPDAVIDDANDRIVGGDRGVPDYLGAEAVVSQEDVANSGNQYARCHRGARLGYMRQSGIFGHPVKTSLPEPLPSATTIAMMPMKTQPKISIANSFLGLSWVLNLPAARFVGGKVQIAAVPVVQIGGWVVIDHHSDVLVALNVLMHRRDTGGLAGDEDVLRVGVAPWPQSDLAAPRDADPAHQYRVEFGSNRVVGQRIPPVDAVGNLRDQAGGDSGEMDPAGHRADGPWPRVTWRHTGR